MLLSSFQFSLKLISFIIFFESSIDITFLKGDSKKNKHYDKDFISPSVSLILNQMIKHDTPSLTKALFKSKVL